MNIPYLPDELVSKIYDFNRPKLGFECKKGQFFGCDGFQVEINEVRRRPYYNEILIQGHRCFCDEKCGFATTIPLTSPYKDMYIDKHNWIGFEINKNMLRD